MQVAPVAPAPAGLDVCRALLVYEGAARAVITRLKYRNDRAALGWLADGMAGLLAPPPGAVVTWAPTTAARRRRRGFDQAELLAVAVARRWRAPCVPLLVRQPGTPQTGRNRQDRRTGPVIRARASAGHGLRLTRGALPPEAPVVIVDDVVTTGSTLVAAAAALRATGVAWVGALAAARTPAVDRSGLTPASGGA